MKRNISGIIMYIILLASLALVGCTENGFGSLPSDSPHRHVLVHTSATAATCETDGNTEYWFCTDCGRYYADEEAETEIVDTATAVPAAGHDWDEWMSVGDGTHLRTCKNDSAHTETESCAGGSATCTAKAKCLVCGGEYGEFAARKILILEQADESGKLVSLLSENCDYDIEVKNFHTDAIPGTVDELRRYDQIILNNIANKDMPEGFDELLYAYVYMYGGGLFTTGGVDGNGNPNAYDRSDMAGTAYQQILPVQTVDMGVMFIIDNSGSMSLTDESPAGEKLSYLEWAVKGTKSSFAGLSGSDYIGVMTLDSDNETVLPLTRTAEASGMFSALDSLKTATGGTVFPETLVRAGKALSSLTDVEKRHIVLVTDGSVPEAQREHYESFIDINYQRYGITLSVVLINDGNEAQYMQKAVELGHGRLYAVSDAYKISSSMRDDICAEISDFNPGSFNPVVFDETSSIFNGVEYAASEYDGKKIINVRLGGFYGLKLKNNAELILSGDCDVPVYAQWKFGKGAVGSFMCDLYGDWSADFLKDRNGKMFIVNVIANLMPPENIHPSEINRIL